MQTRYLMLVYTFKSITYVSCLWSYSQIAAGFSLVLYTSRASPHLCTSVVAPFRSFFVFLCLYSSSNTKEKQIKARLTISNNKGGVHVGADDGHDDDDVDDDGDDEFQIIQYRHTIILFVFEKLERHVCLCV